MHRFTNWLGDNTQLLMIAGFCCLLFTLFVLQQWSTIWVLIGIVLIVPLAALAVRHPDIVIALAIMLNFTRIAFYLPSGYWLFYFLVGTIVVNRTITKRLTLALDAHTIAWLVILVLALASVNRWHNLKDGIRIFLQLGLTPLLIHQFIKGDYLNAESCGRILSRFFVLVLLYLVAQSIIAMITGSALVRGASLGRGIMAFHGFDVGWAHSNYLAGILVSLSAIVFPQRHHSSNGPLLNGLIWFAVVSALLIAFITISRGAILALFLIIFIYYVLQIIGNRKIHVLPVFAGATILLLLMMPFLASFWFRITHLRLDFPVLCRLFLWTDALRFIRSNVFIGSGPGQYLYNSIFQYMDDPHSIFLRYGVEFGGVSILLLLFVLGYPLYRSVSAYFRYGRDRVQLSLLLAFLPAIVGAIFHSQGEIIITGARYGMLFWLMFAFFIRAQRDLEAGKSAWWL